MEIIQTNIYLLIVGRREVRNRCLRDRGKENYLDSTTLISTGWKKDLNNSVQEKTITPLFPIFPHLLPVRSFALVFRCHDSLAPKEEKDDVFGEPQIPLLPSLQTSSFWSRLLNLNYALYIPLTIVHLLLPPRLNLIFLLPTMLYRL